MNPLVTLNNDYYFRVCFVSVKQHPHCEEQVGDQRCAAVGNRSGVFASAAGIRQGIRPGQKFVQVAVAKVGQSLK